ncbi:TetR/AcrR family transcriptional regulator [uncultured Pseudacidovorax sp.]|uniref:TetR/AcrR family transcriptional regulator n=1 Tax=uncultured Pseudacidovorax sp. TaxID=679313 RepID=UPI0025F1A1A3|nr:TetR/AcrR family transcriptional regulator [uncultured Pseudacidovorax sp.]
MGLDRPTYHHGNLRQALIEAALELARQRGPEGVSVREAARRVGVSSAAPFRHFPSRRSLMTAVAEEATTRLRIEVRRAIRPTDRTALRRLTALGRGYLRWAAEHPAHFRIVSAREQIDIDASPGLLHGMLDVRALTEETLRTAQATGQADPAHDPALLALLTRACAYGLARMRLDGHLPQWGVAPGDEDRKLDAALALLVSLIGSHSHAGTAAPGDGPTASAHDDPVSTIFKKGHS